MSEKKTKQTGINVDRVKGLLAALAIGNALATQTLDSDFKTEDYNSKLDDTVTFKPKGTKTEKTLAPGQGTEPIGMTLALANMLVERKGYEKKYAIHAYYDYVRDNPPVLNPHMKELFLKVKEEKFIAHYREYFKDHDMWIDDGLNLTRIAPLALLNSYLPVLEDCILTNPSKISQDASLIYVDLLWHLLRGFSISSINKRLELLAQTKKCRNIIIAALADKELPAKASGCLISLFYSIKALNFSKQRALMVEIMNQDDINWVYVASTASAVIGAKLGYDLLAQEKNFKYNIGAVQKESTKGTNVMSSKYYLSNLDALSTELVELSQTDPQVEELPSDMIFELISEDSD